jgi:hypothetical protein
MNCNVVIVDDDEIILLHSKIIQKQDCIKLENFNSAEKALFFLKIVPIRKNLFYYF